MRQAKVERATRKEKKKKMHARISNSSELILPCIIPAVMEAQPHACSEVLVMCTQTCVGACVGECFVHDVHTLKSWCMQTNVHRRTCGCVYVHDVWTCVYACLEFRHVRARVRMRVCARKDKFVKLQFLNPAQSRPQGLEGWR